MAEPTVVVIDGQADVERARREVRRLALALGFGRDPAEEVTIAASELATNLLKYAVGGRIGVAPISGPRGTGILIESKDDGPGIGDVSAALLDGQSTGGGLGGGLPGVRRLMDEVEIESNQSGTRITARKWLTLAS